MLGFDRMFRVGAWRDCLCYVRELFVLYEVTVCAV